MGEERGAEVAAVTMPEAWETDFSYPYYDMDGRRISRAAAMRLYEGDFNATRRVAEDYIGEVHISTVLLVIDHSFGDGPPLIFETMIFRGEHDEYQERYATREQALDGHARAVSLVRGESA